MQVTRFEWIVIGAIILSVFGILLHGCSGSATAPSDEVYRKCVEVNAADTTKCDQGFILY